MIADATIARLRAKLEDRELTPEEEVAILLELMRWYKKRASEKSLKIEKSSDINQSSKNK